MRNLVERVDFARFAALALAGLTVSLALRAGGDQAIALATSHGGWCGLSGSGQVVFLGHCATCWAALGTGLAAIGIAVFRAEPRRVRA